MGRSGQDSALQVARDGVQFLHLRDRLLEKGEDKYVSNISSFARAEKPEA